MAAVENEIDEDKVENNDNGVAKSLEPLQLNCKGIHKDNPNGLKLCQSIQKMAAKQPGISKTTLNVKINLTEY